jgi:hypothetical protein
MTTMGMTRAADNDDNKFDGEGVTGDDNDNGVTTTTKMTTTMMAMMATVRWATARRDMTATTMAMGDDNGDDNDNNGKGATLKTMATTTTMATAQGKGV